MINTIFSDASFYENFLQKISQDYNLPYNELILRYLYNDKKTFNKIMKKHKSKKLRKIHAYNIFLSDKQVINKVLKDNNTENQTEINKQKGKLWKSYKNKPEILEKYEKIAMLENKHLLTKNYREKLLLDWNTYKTKINQIINDDSITSLSETIHKLELN